MLSLSSGWPKACRNEKSRKYDRLAGEILACTSQKLLLYFFVRIWDEIATNYGENIERSWKSTKGRSVHTGPSTKEEVLVNYVE